MMETTLREHEAVNYQPLSFSLVFHRIENKEDLAELEKVTKACISDLGQRFEELKQARTTKLPEYEKIMADYNLRHPVKY